MSAIRMAQSALVWIVSLRVVEDPECTVNGIR
jgi:hypothetical protein